MKRNYFTHHARAVNYVAFIGAIICFMLGAISSNAQITVTPNQTAAALAQELVGTGVIILNPTMNCPTQANGIFVVTASNLGLDSGVILTNGVANSSGSIIGTNSAANSFASNSNNTGGDADLNSLSSQTTYDACVLEFDFIPAGDTIKFDYVFGSEEYTSFTCTQYNDVFGFFIQGPGYPVKTNIALVPGTNIPVCINSVNGATPSHPGYVAYCQAVGPGSPFNAYFRTNTGSTVTYDGLTVVMTAVAAVTPCDTYHLKLGVADASDHVLDSGVWLKAGSLNSVNTGIFSVGGGGLTQPVNYCVRGCQPGEFVFTRPVPFPTPLTIHYLISGTAANGTDYTQIPDSVVIPAGDTSTILYIQGLNEPVPLGPKTVMLYIYSPYACGGSTPIIIDSSLMTIYDSIYVQILNNDTAICKYDSIQLSVYTDSILSVQWRPATGLSNPFSRTPWAKPLVTTIYQVVVNMPLSGCYPSHDSMTLTINVSPVVDAGPTLRNICLGMNIPFSTTVTPTNQTYTYLWTPGTYLSATNIANPVSTPTAVGNIQYVIKVSPTAIGCDGYDTINVHVLPNDFTLFNQDTALCFGATVQVRAAGDTEFTYSWTPTVGVSNVSSLTPVISPDTTATYIVTGSYPGCPLMVHSFNIDVQPNPVVVLGSDRQMCEWDTLQLHSGVSPGWYTKYTYSWTPASDLNYSYVPAVVYFGDSSSTVVLTVTTPAGCKGVDSIHVIVHPGGFGKLLTFTDTSVCPLAEPLQMIASGGVSYKWSPNYFMDNANLANPAVIPAASIIYTVLVTDQYNCHDTLSVNLIVNPRAVLEMPDSVTLYPGESYQMNPQGNGVRFRWFPPVGLSSDSVSNPIAMLDVNTLYFLTATTESNCTITDSIKVYVNPETLLDVPNAFVPGSGPNGELKIIKRGIATLKYFRIFNRWGQEVFSTGDINNGWDGRYNGTPQPVGVYVYMVEAFTNTGRQFVKQGNVTLIR